MEMETFRSSSSSGVGKGSFLLTSMAGYAASSAVLAIYTRFCLLKLAAAAAGPSLASVFLFALQSMSGSLLAAVLMTVLNLAGLNRRPRSGTSKLPSSSASAMAGIMLSSDQYFSRENHPLYTFHFTFKFATRLFFPTVLFSISAFTDMELLGRHANPETVFVIHCCTTMVVATGEAICTKKGGVNSITKEAVASLLILIGGSVSYVLHESHFLLNNYSCALAFLFCKATELLYIKQLTVSMPDLRAWNFVIHRSLLSLVLVPPFIFMFWNAGARNFHLDHMSYIVTLLAAPAVILSCLLTFAAGSYGYQAVKLASATTCMVIEAFSHLPVALFRYQALLPSPGAVLLSGGGLVSILICILGAFMFIHFQMNPCSGYDEYLAFISTPSSPTNSFQELTDNLQSKNRLHDEAELKE